MDERTLNPWQIKDAPTIHPRHVQSDESLPTVASININGWKTKTVLETRDHCTIYLAERDTHEQSVIKLYQGKTTASSLLIPILPKDRHLLPIVETGMHEEQSYDISPYFKDGTLDGHTLSAETVMNIVVPQLAHALNVLHQKRLLHNDVKPSNLFWSWRDKEIVLGDYDTLTRNPAPAGAAMAGTKEYMAPEVLTGGLSEASEASDYCSMGLTLLSLLQGVSPLHGKTDIQIRRLWMRGIQLPSQIPPQLKVLINGLIQYRPDQRLDAEGIRRWMDTYHVEHVVQRGSTPSPKAHSSDSVVPLWFDEYPVFSIGEMVEQAGKQWDFGSFLLSQKKFSLFLRQFSFDHYRLCCECEKRYDKNEGLFILLHTLAKTEDFYWFGKHFQNLEEFATYHLESDDIATAQHGGHFLRANMLNIYLRNINASQDMLELAKKLSQVARQQPELAMTQLLTSMSAMPVLKWKGETFHTLEDVVKWLLINVGNLDEQVHELYTSKRFEAWLTFINQGAFLYEVQNAMKGMAL